MCHRKVISGHGECLRHHPPLPLNNAYVKKSKKEKVRNPIVHLVENILLVAAVKLLNGGEELIGGNPADHLVVAQCQEEEEEEEEKQKQKQHQHHPTNHLAVQHNVNKTNNNIKVNNPPANLEYIPGFTHKY